MTRNTGTLDSVPPVALAGRPLARGDETRAGRLRAWTTSALRDLVYAGAVFVWSIAAFTILVTGVSVTLSLLVLIVGVFVWVGFVYVVRGMTWVDRRLTGWQRHEPIRAVYRRPAASGFVPLLKTVSADPQTWRDLGWLALTSVVGFTLGLAAAFAVMGIGLVLAPLALLLARGCAAAHAALATHVLSPPRASQ